MSEEITFAVTLKLELHYPYWSSSKAENQEFIENRIREGLASLAVINKAQIKVEQIHGPTND